MIPLLSRMAHEILWHENKARIWFRAFLLWLSAIGAQIALSDYSKWNGRDWGLHLGVAAVAGIAGLVSTSPPTKEKS